VHDTSAALANITAPADAQHVADWIDETGTGITWGRCVRGTRGATAGIEIVVAGWQSADGPRSGDDFPLLTILTAFFAPTGAASKAIPAAPGPGDLLTLTSKPVR
jgi:hypothetical protein